MFGLIPELRGSEQRRPPFRLLQLPTLAVFGDVLSHAYRTNRPSGRQRPLIYRVFLVGDTGFEPVTSSVSGKRATAAPIAQYSIAHRGGDGIRTRVNGFAGRCLET